MKLQTTLLLVAAIGGFIAGAANAQQSVQREDVIVRVVPGESSRTERVQQIQHTIESSHSGGVAARIMHSEFGIEGKVVKGAPYSAEAVNESTQILADGNRIVHKETTALYRDSDGRTRREVTPQVIGIGGAAAQPLPKLVFIYDPVANVSYTLDTTAKTARKIQGRGMALQIERKIEGSVSVAPPPPPPPPPGADVFVRRPGLPMHDAAGKAESLGKQTIEGVVADGTRSTGTIPAGQIGNERPITIVSERWYSPELQTVIMTRNSDPRFGESSYKLTNIRRTEPLKSLFEVPADYTIK